MNKMKQNTTNETQIYIQVILTFVN